MKRERKKTSNPVFGFRISPEDKAWLEGELDQLKVHVNRGKSANDKVINKSDILLEALRRGFGAIRRTTGR